MRRINRCLNKQLLTLCQHAVLLDDLNLKLTHFLPPELRDHCSIGSFNKGCLIIVTADASFATQLRYALPDLRDKLRKEAGLYQLISIKIQITADSYTSHTTKPKAEIPPLSTAARMAVLNAEELCSYVPLKKALLHLANSNDSCQKPDDAVND